MVRRGTLLAILDGAHAMENVASPDNSAAAVASTVMTIIAINVASGMMARLNNIRAWMREMDRQGKAPDILVMSENNIAKRNLDKNEVFLTNLFDQYKGFHIPNSAEPRGKEKTSRKGKATQPNNSESATTKNAKKKTEKKEAGRRGIISVFVNQMWCTFIEQTMARKSCRRNGGSGTLRSAERPVSGDRSLRHLEGAGRHIGPNSKRSDRSGLADPTAGHTESRPSSETRGCEPFQKDLPR